MAHPNDYQEFCDLQTRYWSRLLRVPAIALAAMLLSFAKESLPDWLFGLGFFAIACVFIITWFQAAATYFRAMNWRCPDCQHRFSGFRGSTLMNSILIQRCRHCGSKPDYDAPISGRTKEAI